MRRSIISFAFVLSAALLLGACGGGDSETDTPTSPAQVATSPDDSKSKSSADKQSGNGGEDGKAGAKKPNRREAARIRRATRRERNRARRQRSLQLRQLRTPGGKAPKPGSKPKPGQKAPAPTPRDAQPQLPKTADATFKAAKLVCGGLYETALRGKTKDEVAKDYARPWPKDRQEAAYKGCLEGLQLPRPNPDDEADY
jgi:hypothetical protein